MSSTIGHSWWPAPVLRRDAELGRERKVGWLELFFDLVFVVLIARPLEIDRIPVGPILGLMG